MGSSAWFEGLGAVPAMKPGGWAPCQVADVAERILPEDLQHLAIHPKPLNPTHPKLLNPKLLNPKTTKQEEFGASSGLTL